MLIVILIVGAIVLAGAGFGITVWFAFRNKKLDEHEGIAPEAVKTETLRFNISYMLAPLIIMVIAIVLTVIYAPGLPDQVGYHFRSSGLPDRWLSGQMAMVLMILPQVMLTLLSAGIISGITRIGLLTKQSKLAGIKSETLLMLMGNVSTLPQLVLTLTMLDIFHFNVNMEHLFPEAVLLTILGIAFAVLVIILIYLIISSRKKLKQQSEE